MVLRPRLSSLLLAVMVTSAYGGAADDTTSQQFRACVLVRGCSGIIIAKGNREAVGVSASHCLTKVGDVFTFYNPDGTEGVARWMGNDPNVDLSIFKCWSKDVIGVSPVLEKNKPRQDPYIGWGYPKTKGPKLKRLRYHGEANIESLKGGRSVYEVKSGEFTGGDSGGGVFSNGDLIGITSHGDKKGKWLYSCTHLQLVTFLKKYQHMASCNLIARKPPEDGAPPLDSDKDRTEAIRVLIARLARLESEGAAARATLEKITRTPIRVQILDPKTGKVLLEKAYPWGTPVKLLLPEK